MFRRKKSMSTGSLWKANEPVHQPAPISRTRSQCTSHTPKDVPIRSQGAVTRSQSTEMRRQSGGSSEAGDQTPPHITLLHSNPSRKPEPVLAEEIERQRKQNPHLFVVETYERRLYPSQMDLMSDYRQVAFRSPVTGKMEMVTVEKVPHFHRKKQLRRVKKKLKF